MKQNNCLICNKAFETFRSQVGKYCSRECYYEMKRTRGDRVNWTEDMRLRFSEKQKGSNNPAWRGGVTKERTKQLNTITYKRFKKTVMERDNHMCVSCGAGDNLQVDHIKPWKLYPELRWEINNAQILCAPCHYKKSSEEGKKYWVNQYTQA